MTKPAGVSVRAHELRKDYGRGEALVRAVDEVDLEVANGEALAVMGPSGCGKSTLLHLLGGLDRPTSGELWLGKRRIDQLSERALAEIRRHDVGFVFQAFHLMDELTAQENVELPALLAGRSPRQARRRACQLLDEVGLADRGDHLPSALSGGQRQRVAIALRTPFGAADQGHPEHLRRTSSSTSGRAIRSTARASPRPSAPLDWGHRTRATSDHPGGRDGGALITTPGSGSGRPDRERGTGDRHPRIGPASLAQKVRSGMPPRRDPSPRLLVADRRASCGAVPHQVDRPDR